MLVLWLKVIFKILRTEIVNGAVDRAYSHGSIYFASVSLFPIPV